MRKLDSESSTDKSIITSAIIKGEKSNCFASNDDDDNNSASHVNSENNINNEKLTNSSSSNELFSDSLENIHSATGNLIKSKDSLSANQINNSNDTSSSRNRNSSISSSTSTGSEGGMQIYEVENAMITNKMIYADKDKSNCKNYNSLEFADLTEKDDNDYRLESRDAFDENNLSKTSSSSLIKRTLLKDLIHNLYDIDASKSSYETNSFIEKPVLESTILVEGVMEKLPHGKNLKNSILLAWKRRYFRLSVGTLFVYENQVSEDFKGEPLEVYNLMGARVEYEQNRVISLDDCRGNYLVCRCCSIANDDKEGEKEFLKWKNAIDSLVQIDRSDFLWVRPNRPLIKSSQTPIHIDEKKVLILDIGTCSVRAGVFNNIPQLPKLFVPTVCSRSLNSKLNVGFEAFDALLSSAAPSTIDLHKSPSMWSLGSNMNHNGSQLIFPLRAKNNIDKSNMDMECIEAIFSYAIESLNICCPEYQIVVITTHKLSDKVNTQFLNLLLGNEKFKFESAVIINQSLLTLYAYNSSTGICVNLGEHIDIVPICNGNSTLFDILNSFKRGHF
jgi:hypothetical protein